MNVPISGGRDDQTPVRLLLHDRRRARDRAIPGRASAQAPVPSEAWTLQTEQPVEWLRFLPAQLLVVSHDGA
jgi:hypothetical protein